MRHLLRTAVAIAFLAPPLFAAKATTVRIPEPVTVGLIKVPAGDYKVTYEGAGPDVKVTMVQSGKAPILLGAKLVPSEKASRSVTLGTVNGVRTLHDIQLTNATLIFEKPE